MVDMFSKWVEAFPLKHQTALKVAKILVTDIIPTFGIPTKISCDNGPAFVAELLVNLSTYLGINLKHHCSYHPQSAGACERESLTWVQALPLVLMQMRMRIRQKNGLSPFEILFGRPPTSALTPPGYIPPNAAFLTGDMLTYCRFLCSQLSSLHSLAAAHLPQPVPGPLHCLKPGDWILIKSPSKKHWNSPRWLGPFQVLLTTDTAIKTEGQATWIHATHCKKVPDPPLL
ncbi:hypothetical protein LDENG_00244570 [Lucifuga dentata]|nr:hypothetical protein LDENG_00244570 [Lucifuga dentata]